MCRNALMVFLIALLLGASPLLAGNAKSGFVFSADLGSQAFSGFTQYELQFPFYDSLGEITILRGHSRLKFPLESYLAGGNLQVAFEGLKVGFGYWKQFHSRISGKVEDFDWLTIPGASLTWAYGRAKPFPKIYNWKLEIGYDVKMSRVHIGPFFRYSKFHTEFSVNDLSQYQYFDFNNLEPIDPPLQSSVTGMVLQYEQDLKIPLFGIWDEISLIANKFSLNSELGYSPLVSVSDYDRHLIREDSLRAWNDGDGGNAFIFELGAKVNVFQAFQLSLCAGYLEYKINTTGTQITRNEETGVWSRATGADTEVRGVLRHAQLALSYKFAL